MTVLHWSHTRVYVVKKPASTAKNNISCSEAPQTPFSSPSTVTESSPPKQCQALATMPWALSSLPTTTLARYIDLFLLHAFTEPYTSNTSLFSLGFPSSQGPGC
jgi:hypothetical protein